MAKTISDQSIQELQDLGGGTAPRRHLREAR